LSSPAGPLAFSPTVFSYNLQTGWSFVTILTGTTLGGRTLINSEITFNGTVNLTPAAATPITVLVESDSYGCILATYQLTVTQSLSSLSLVFHAF
jgi:hypothetical protein